jgi:hypothetical protein
MDRLITLILSAVLSCPMWAGAQTIPTVIGTFTWNFNPPLEIISEASTLSSPAYCFYTVSSLPITITHLGSDQYSLMSYGVASASNTSQCDSENILGSGVMSLSGANYKLSMQLSIPFPSNSAYALFNNASCSLNATTLSGQCIVPGIIGQYGGKYTATFVPK